MTKKTIKAELLTVNVRALFDISKKYQLIEEIRSSFGERSGKTCFTIVSDSGEVMTRFEGDMVEIEIRN